MCNSYDMSYYQQKSVDYYFVCIDYYISAFNIQKLKSYSNFASNDRHVMRVCNIKHIKWVNSAYNIGIYIGIYIHNIIYMAYVYASFHPKFTFKHFFVFHVAKYETTTFLFRHNLKTLKLWIFKCIKCKFICRKVFIIKITSWPILCEYFSAFQWDAR